MNKNFLILLLVMLLPTFMYGQGQIQVTGTVIDNTLLKQTSGY